VARSTQPEQKSTITPTAKEIAQTAEIESVKEASVAQENPVSALTSEGRPQWAGSAFECLLFQVAGLQLAVPLVLLGAIHRIETDIHGLPGRPGWFMGILSTPQANLRVVDTAKWVMPGREPESVQSNYQFVIRLDDSDWGLACDAVAQSFRLDPEAVKWRSERSRRPWLAGTVIDHMCALVDVRTMAQLLSRAEQEQHLDITG
jgi:purine-binding chemotaxis protein CheW